MYHATITHFKTQCLGEHLITLHIHSDLSFCFLQGRRNRNQHDKYYNHPQNTDIRLCNALQHTQNALSPLPDLEVLPIKGQRAADQCVENDPQAPDVHLRPIILLALEELGGCVGRGAAERVQLVPQSKFITEAKVRYLDVHVRIQQQVLCLQTDSVGARGSQK